MTTRVWAEQLQELLAGTGVPPDRIEVVGVAAGRWPDLKPALAAYLRRCRELDLPLPRFTGVPLCLFGSEWPGFPSVAPPTPPGGRCTPCQARSACGFGAEVPDGLHPISDRSQIERWREYAAAFERVTGNGAATRFAPFVETLVDAYRGPISLEPSVLLSDGLQPSARFVAFPHRAPPGVDPVDHHRTVLACAANIASGIGAKCPSDLVDDLGALPPVPVPIGIDELDGALRLKLYLRLESSSPAERRALLEVLGRFAPDIDLVTVDELQMIGLVLGADGLQGIKAYVVANPTGVRWPRFPAPLAADHRLVAIAVDRCLATVDVWSREGKRESKWDFNVRDHYFAGAAAENLARVLAGDRSAEQLRPLLVGTTYRADVVAIGVRGGTTALYMELN